MCFSNSSSIVCVSPHLENETLLGEPLDIEVTLASGARIDNFANFTYKPDPNITYIYPRKSITKWVFL